MSATPAQKPTLLSIRNIAKTFGRNVVLRNVSLEIAEGEFLTILGESGSGKTTLLRIIAGFETATSGEVWMGAERLDQQPPYRRRVNTVFQNYAPLVGRQRIQPLAAHPDFAAAGLFEARDQSQQCCFPGTTLTQKREKFA